MWCLVPIASLRKRYLSGAKAGSATSLELQRKNLLMCSTAGTLVQKIAFPVPELFCGPNNKLWPVNEHIFIYKFLALLKIWSAYVPSFCVGLLKICLEK